MDSSSPAKVPKVTMNAPESEGYGVQGFDKELAPVQDSHQDGHLPRRCGQDGVLRLRMQACARVNSPSGTGEEFFQLAGTLLDVRRAARLRPNNKLSNGSMSQW